MKKAEHDFYRRNAGGPVAMTSMTRGRGVFGIIGGHDDHCGAYRVALNKAALDWDRVWRAMADDDRGD